MNSILKNPQLVTTKEAVTYLEEQGFRTTAGTLEVRRCQKKSPKYKKVGNRVYYEQAWLDEFISGLEVKIFDPATA